MIDRRAFEFSFGWMFALIVGAMLLFLAIYAAANLIRSERHLSDSYTSKELSILLNPLQTNLESTKSTSLSFGQETRIFNECKLSLTFGEQRLRIATRSGVGETWKDASAPSTSSVQYIFSAGTVQATSFFVIIKPFFFPFKVADLIYLIPADVSYCFVNPPRAIEGDIELFKPHNINVSTAPQFCKPKSVKVCFASTGCDIEVNMQAQTVRKDKQLLYFAADPNNALLLGAVFADPALYECQLKRLAGRASQLSQLYHKKAGLLAVSGCNSNLEVQLLLYANATQSLTSSRDIRTLQSFGEELGRNNEALTCKIF